MYIDQMEISGFGIYSGLSLNLEPGLNIILGENEAGKSTCHEFVRFMLYGRPRGASRYEPLRGGEHGGELELVTLAEQSFRLKRTGKEPNKFSLVDENFEKMEPEMLAHILGQAGAELYNTVFAFSIKELYDLNALDPEETPDVLCGINFGLGSMSISKVLKTLEQRREKIYKPSGSNPDLNRLFKELGGVREKLTPLRNNLAAYAALNEELTRLGEENASLQTELHKLLAELDKFKIAGRLFPQWREKTGLEEALRGFPALGEADFLPDDPGRLVEFEIREKDNAARHADLQTRLGEIEAALAAWQGNPALLEVDELVTDLTGRREQYRESRDLLPQKRAELAELRREIDGIRAYLDQNWSSAQAVSFNFSKKDHVEQLLSDLEQSGREAAKAQGERDGLLREAEELAAREKLADLPASGALRADLRKLESLADEERSLNFDLKVEIINAAAEHRTWQVGALLLGLFFAICGGAAAGISVSPWAGFGAGAAIMVLSALPALFWPKREGKPLRRMRERLTRLAEEKSAACAAFGIAGVSREELGQVEKQLDAVLAWEQLKERAATEAAKAEVNSNNFAGLRTKLRDFLSALGINPDCPGDEVRALFNRAQELRPLMERESALKVEIETLERRVDAFSNGLRELMFRTRLDWSADADGVPEPLDTLARTAEAVQAAKAASLERGHKEETLKNLRAEAERQISVGAAIAEERQKFLQSRGAASVEAFQEAFNRWSEWKKLKSRFAQLQNEITTGAGERRDEVFSLLSYITKEKLDAQIINLTGHTEEQTRRVAGQNQRLGEIRQRRDALIDEKDFEDLRFKEETLKQEISEAARAWTRETLALHAISEAKAFFEQERQPKVMRLASDWFKTITLGEYAGISPGSEPGAMEVLTARREARPVTQLSRGTREQLFLAMRLALIGERGREAEPLPVLMDDILVNFDPERAKAAASAVLSLAGNHQILFFTCHPHTADLLESLARKKNRPAGRFVIKDGRLQG